MKSGWISVFFLGLSLEIQIRVYTYMFGIEIDVSAEFGRKYIRILFKT